MAQRALPTNQDWKEKLEALNQLVILNPMHAEFIQQIHQKMLEVIS
jgi:HKD family nuclease